MTHHPPKLDKPVRVNSLVTSDPIKKFVEKRAESVFFAALDVIPAWKHILSKFLK